MSISTQILSDITVFTKYARYWPHLQRRETWEEMCCRNMEMHINKFPHMKEEIECVYKSFVIPKKVLPSMRSLQFGGLPIEISPNRMFNCAAVAMDDYRSFSETMFLLLGGSGMGYSVQKHHIEKLPAINKPNNSEMYLIGDSIEGWSDAVKVLIEAYMFSKPMPLFDFSGIRNKGAPLITSGGKAPGPQPLKDCLHNLQKVLDSVKPNAKLTPLQVHDIMCFIADAVLAGGIRRAALICLFDIDDEEMLTCKFGNWWELNPQRARANNSVMMDRSTISEEKFMEVWKKIEASGSGEPGFYLTNSLNMLTNPCITGDTLIAVADSRNAVPIKDLVGQQYPVYAIENGKTVIKKSIKTWKTRENAEIWKLTLDDGSVLRGTPDHLIMLRNGTYKPLKDLLFNDSLMPFNSYTSNTHNHRVVSVEFYGYEDVYDMTVEDVHNFGVITSYKDGKFIDSSGVFIHNCVEIALRPQSFCNLCEINMHDVVDQDDLNARSKAASFIGTLQASYTNFHYLRPIWHENAEEEALLGVSGTGIASGAVLLLDETEAARVVLEENDRVAKLIGINKAARTTCIKPSGTTSCVLGTSSGIHAWHDQYFIRRMRIGKNESIYGYLATHHPELLEDEYFKPHLESVISIPMKAPDGAILRDESPIQLLERVKRFSERWIKTGHRAGINTHNVSATVSIKPNEWGDVGGWVWLNRAYFNGLSVLGFDGGSYKQAPFESCSKEKYEEMMISLSAIDLTQVVEYEDETDRRGELACSGVSCEMR